MIPNYQYKSEWMEISATSKLNFPPHFHLEMEFLYVVRGCMQVQVGDAFYTMGAGEFIVIFPNLVHAYLTKSEPTDTYFIVLNCVPKVMDEYTNTIMLHHPKNPLLPSDRVHPDAVHAIYALLDLSAAKEQSRVMIKAYYLLFMAHLWPHLEFEPNQKANITADLATQIVFYLADHFTEQLSLESVAREFGIDRYTLSRVFSKTIQCSFPDYLNQLRVEHAKKLLHCTDKRILTIALECGFSNQQTFNRVFRGISEVTPGEFRRQQWSRAAFEKGRRPPLPGRETA